MGVPIDNGAFLRLFGEHIDPRDGRRLGRAMPTYKQDWQKVYRALLRAEPDATAERREELKAEARDQAVPWRRIYQGLLAAEPEATAERRAELRTQAMAQVRQAVPYFDATFSPSKDISVLHASFMAASIRARQADDVGEAVRLRGLADVVWAAVMEGNQAMLDYLQEHAGYTRSGSHARKAGQVSTGQWEDAHRFVVASFRQHTSRNGDPQLHVHNTILNCVRRESDGAWRTLDGAALYRERGAAAAVAALVMENALARDLGVEFAQRKDGHGRVIRGISQKLVDAFSTRTRQDIEGRLPELIEAYRLRFGRDPDARALYGLRHRATLVTRVRKEPGLSPGEQVARWAQRARRADGQALEPVGPRVCARLNGRAAAEPGAPLSRQDELSLMRQALAQVSRPAEHLDPRRADSGTRRAAARHGQRHQQRPGAGLPAGPGRPGSSRRGRGGRGAAGAGVPCRACELAPRRRREPVPPALRHPVCHRAPAQHGRTDPAQRWTHQPGDPKG